MNIEDYSKEELQNILDNSYSYSDVLHYLGLSINSSNIRLLHLTIYDLNLNEEILNKNRNCNPKYFKKKSNNPISLNELLVDGKIVNTNSLKNKLFKNGLKEEKCELCGITSWNSNPLSFQLHHIDGNRENNKIDNLMILCPNCHSQTDNYAGKKAKKKSTKKCFICQCKISRSAKYCRTCYFKYIQNKNSDLIIDREKLKELIRNNSFVSVGKMFNISDNAIRKWCEKYDLPRKTSEIRKYTDDEWENI